MPAEEHQDQRRRPGLLSSPEHPMIWLADLFALAVIGFVIGTILYRSFGR
jgi:hypothetical protein